MLAKSHYSVYKRYSGFTLIELVIVIVILGIIAITALPKFINLGDDARIASVHSTSGSFKSAINLARTVWATKVGSGPAENLPVFGSQIDGELDFNDTGWPAQHWQGGLEASPKLDNVEDCLSVWITLFQGSEPSASRLNKDAAETTYKAEYLGNNRCRYNFNDNDKLGIIYNSQNGEVSADLDPNS